MRILSIVHQDDCGPGVFADAAEQAGTELVQWQIATGVPRPTGSFDAILSLGGAPFPDAQDGFVPHEVEFLQESIRAGLPVLGVCLGAELVARALGADVGLVDVPEIGWLDVELLPESARDPLLGGLPSPLTAAMSHSWGFDLPEGAVPLARSASTLHAFRYGDRVWGLLFHPEVRGDDFRAWMSRRPTPPEEPFVGSPVPQIMAVGEVVERIPTEMPRWNETGREIFRRFVALVATPPPPVYATLGK